MGAFPPQSSGSGSALLGLGVLAAWLLFGLIGHDPWKPDEAYTFGLVWHIVDSGEWLVPTLGGEPFVEKPPLFFWTAALFVKALDWLLPAHDAARLASGFYVALALWFTYLASGKRIAAALLLAGCLGYLQHAHQLLTDNALLAGIAVGVYGLAARRGLFLGTGAGIAFLAKGLLGPGMLALSAAALLAFPAWRVRAYFASLGWAALAFVPWALIWPLALYLRSRSLFDEWFWVNNLGRFSGSAGLGGVLDHWLYLKALPWFALPALPIAAWGAWRERRNSAIHLPLVVFAVMLLVLSAASSARTVYGLPMLVPLAMLGALALGSLPGWLRLPLEHLGLWLGGLAAVFLWIAWLALLLDWPLSPRIAAFSPGYPPHIAIVPLLFAVAATAAWLFVLLVAPRDELRMPIVWTAGVTVAWALAMTIWLPFLDHSKSYRSVVADFQQHLVPGACVASRNLSEPQRAVFHYFAGVVSVREGTPAARPCPLLLVHSSSNAEPPHGGEWRIVWRGTRPGDDKEFFWLLQR